MVESPDTPAARQLLQADARRVVNRAAADDHAKASIAFASCLLDPLLELSQRLVDRLSTVADVGLKDLTAQIGFQQGVALGAQLDLLLDEHATMGAFDRLHRVQDNGSRESRRAAF